MRPRYTVPALADLNSVLDYSAAQSPQGARWVQVRIQPVLDFLLLYTGIGTRTDDPIIRRMTVSPQEKARRHLIDPLIFGRTN